MNATPSNIYLLTNTFIMRFFKEILVILGIINEDNTGI